MASSHSFCQSVSQSVSCLGSKHLLNECPLLGTVVHILVGSCSKDIDNKLEEVELNMTMIKVYSFSMAALTNYHKVRDLTQIYSLIFLVVRSLKLFYKVKNQDIGRAVPSEGFEGESFPCLIAAGGSWHSLACGLICLVFRVGILKSLSAAPSHHCLLCVKSPSGSLLQGYIWMSLGTTWIIQDNLPS